MKDLKISQKEAIKLRGRVVLTLKDLSGRVIAVRSTDNLWVNAGKNHLLNLMGDQPGLEPWTYTSIGTSNSPANAANVKLGTEVGRRAIVVSTVSTSQSTTQSSFYEVGYPGITYDIVEVGLWCGGTLGLDSGTLFARAVVSAVQKIMGTHTLTVDWVISC